MSQYLPLSARNIEYILELFDAGSTLHQILDALYARGQVDVQFVTLQRCLREHGRLLSSLPDTGFSQASTQSLAPTYNWNIQADNYAILAHRYGKTISEITAQLRNNGYINASSEQVTASLIKQGVTNVN